RVGVAARGEPRERIRRDRHLDVADGDVEEAREYEVGRDRDEPDGRDEAADSRPAAENREPDDHLDHARDVHEHTRRDGKDGSGERAQVTLPVGEEAEELIRAGEERRTPEADPERDACGIELVVVHVEYLHPYRVATTRN